MNYPRTLSPEESEFVRWLLPEESVVYRDHYSEIMGRTILGEGRWGKGDLMLGYAGQWIDLTAGMAPVVAFGECLVGDHLLTISIHEPNLDDMIEIHFGGVFPIPHDLVVTNGWTYSYWKPGMPCPATGTTLREVSLGDGKYTLALSSAKKTIWLHHAATAFNQLIPVTGFMDELLRTHRIRDAESIMQPSKVFERLDEFTDEDLQLALLEYNKIAQHKFDATGIHPIAAVKNRSILEELLNRWKHKRT